MDLISVIIPVYNVEKYLEQCLDSVINQTYRNLEIILVDDGSTDTSGYICDRYGEKDARVKVVHKKNKGVSAARNAGLDLASGDWIGFVDSDDYLEAEMYEVLLSLAKQADADIALTHYRRVEPSGQVEAPAWTDEVTVWGEGGIIEAYISGESAYKISNSVWDRLYKTTLAQGLRFPEGKVSGEDFAYTLEAFCKCRRAVYTDHPYYYYRLNRPDCLSLNPDLGDLLEVANGAVECLYRHGYHRQAVLYFCKNYIGYSYMLASASLGEESKKQIANYLSENRGSAVGLLKGNDIGKIQKMKLGVALISSKQGWIIRLLVHVQQKLLRGLTEGRKRR